MDIKKFKRSSTDSVIGGVCGGLAKLTDQPSWLWRVGALVACFVLPLVAVGYIFLWVIVPDDHQPKQA